MFDTFWNAPDDFEDGEEAGHPAAEPHDSAESPPGSAFAGLSDQQLEATLCSHATHIAVAECRFVLMAAEVDRRGFWAVQGARSCAHWLNWRCGLSLVTAREQVRVGHALATLPLVRAAFEEGRISYSKARAITRIATRELEGRLVEMALDATAAQLETIVRAFRRAFPGEGRQALLRHQGRYLRSYTDADGMVVIHGRFSPEDAATVLSAIELARSAQSADRAGSAAAPGGDADDSAESSLPPAGPEAARDAAPPAGPGGAPHEDLEDPSGASRADALVALCELAIAGGVTPGSVTGPHHSLLVHVDQQVLAEAANEGCAHVEGIGALSAHTVQRLACDASVSTVVYRADGAVVPEGKTRQIPVRLRRAVLARDGGCRWPGCSHRRYVDVHHVVFVSRGGKTELSNLTTLCRFHHRLVHEGGYTLSMDKKARVRVVSPGGSDLTELGRGRPAAGPDIAAQHAQAGLQIDDTTMPTGGGPFDLDITIDVLDQERRRPDAA